MASDATSVQEKEWQALHDKITETLNRFGTKDAFGKGDYWLVDDNWGWYRHQLEFQNLNLFHPDIIRALQALLIDFPDWEITARVDAIGKEESWPGMGLIVARDKIVDELRREFLPPEFQSFHYQGSRPLKIPR